MSYRVLVLPDRPNISLPVLRKLKELVAAGATVIGPKPQYATGLTDFPQVRRGSRPPGGRAVGQRSAK